jgi:hypothetical protein
MQTLSLSTTTTTKREGFEEPNALMQAPIHRPPPPASRQAAGHKQTPLRVLRKREKLSLQGRE